jgi:2,5-diketo-D-gluconate reductase A
MSDTLRRMERTSTIPDRTLHDGTTIPQLGLGVWQIEDDEVVDVVATAIDSGCRHVDTARIYRNERGVGEGIRRSGIDRDDIFVTTKLWNSDQGRDTVRAACEASLELLGLDAVDLYLIHWPAPAQDLYVESWRALVELRDAGLARSIGVSNFHAEHLDRIIDATGVVPTVNQVELHPYFQQRELRAVHDRLGIATEAWSPLGQGGELLADPTLTRIAEAHGCTTAQVAIAWQLAEGTIVIPKSSNPARIAQNLAAADIELTSDDLATIAALDRTDGRIGPDPAHANF